MIISQSESPSFKDFVFLTRSIITDIDNIKKDLLKASRGNQRAALRARVSLIKLQKDGKLFRKLSIKYVSRISHDLDSN